MASWRALLEEATRSLGGDNPHEARWMLEAASDLPSGALMLALDDEAPDEAARNVSEMVARRLSGEPLQHVLGDWEWRTLRIVVDGRALVPRPETELLVDHALEHLDRLWQRRQTREPEGDRPTDRPTAHPTARPADRPIDRPADRLLVVDLGTGSGVIALSLAREREFLEVVAVDTSSDALALAAENLARQDEGVAARVRLVKGDWFEGLPKEWAGQVAAIVSNPPYVAAFEWEGLDPVVRDFDPYDALVSGETGLEALAHLIREAPSWLRAGGVLVAEIAPHQRQPVLDFVGAEGPLYDRARVENDLAGRPRILVARRAS